MPPVATGGAGQPPVSEMKQSVHLHDESAVAQRGSPHGHQDIRIAVLGVHNEQFAARRILPTQPDVRTEDVGA
jgi:hypothetical protein